MFDDVKLKEVCKVQRLDDIFNGVYEPLRDEEEKDDEYYVDVANAIFQAQLALMDSILQDTEFYLVSGSAETWRGSHEYHVQKVGNFDAILTKLSTNDDAEIVAYKRRKGYFLEISAFHHDGTNYMKLVDFDGLNKQEIINIFGDFVDLKLRMKKDKMISEIEDYFYYNN